MNCLFSFPDGRYLISQGANVGVVNSEGETPLDIAEEEAMVELLQNEINRQGASPMSAKPSPQCGRTRGPPAYLVRIRWDRMEAVAARCCYCNAPQQKILHNPLK